MPFPALKLLSVLARQLSKPLAQYLQRKAANSTSFKYVCVVTAEKYHRTEQRILRNFYGRQKDMPIVQLNEKKAIEMGSILLGEAVVFSIAAGALVAEYRRQVVKEVLKEQKLSEELLMLNEKIRQLQEENDRLMGVIFPNESRQRENTEPKVYPQGLMESVTKWISDFIPGIIDKNEDKKQYKEMS